jgi:hypothetical protein
MDTQKSSAEEYRRPCACNSGLVSMEIETEDGELEEVLYLCRSEACEAEVK